MQYQVKRVTIKSDGSIKEHGVPKLLQHNKPLQVGGLYTFNGKLYRVVGQTI